MMSVRQASKALEKLLEEQRQLRIAIHYLYQKDNELQKQINNEVFMLPMIYGRCIKELVCDHQSDQHNTSDSTTIHVGDVVKFFRYPLYDHITFHPCGGEWFDVPYSTEYFEFFSEEMLGPNESVKDFNRD